MDITFTGTLWEWTGQGAWCFISLPTDYYADIKTLSQAPKKGFGSIRVEATIGNTTWKTSIFPDSKTKTYLLPVKKAVRSQECLLLDQPTEVRLRLIEV